jgi:hypothetical protein
VQWVEEAHSPSTLEIVSPSLTLSPSDGRESTPNTDQMAHMEVGCPRPKMKSDLMTRNGIGCRDRTWPFPLLVRETLEGGSYAGFVHVGGRGYRLRVCEVGGKISVEMEGSLYQLLANEEAMLRLRMNQNDDVGYAPHLPPPHVCKILDSFSLLLFEGVDMLVELLFLSSMHTIRNWEREASGHARAERIALLSTWMQSGNNFLRTLNRGALQPADPFCSSSRKSLTEFPSAASHWKRQGQAPWRESYAKSRRLDGKA